MGLLSLYSSGIYAVVTPIAGESSVMLKTRSGLVLFAKYLRVSCCQFAAGLPALVIKRLPTPYIHAIYLPSVVHGLRCIIRSVRPDLSRDLWAKPALSHTGSS